MWLGEILRWFARPKMVSHHGISHGGRESNVFIECVERVCLGRLQFIVCLCISHRLTVGDRLVLVILLTVLFTSLWYANACYVF